MESFGRGKRDARQHQNLSRITTHDGRGVAVDKRRKRAHWKSGITSTRQTVPSIRVLARHSTTHYAVQHIFCTSHGYLYIQSELRYLEEAGLTQIMGPRNGTKGCGPDYDQLFTIGCFLLHEPEYLLYLYFIKTYCIFYLFCSSFYLFCTVLFVLLTSNFNGSPRSFTSSSFHCARRP